LVRELSASTPEPAAAGLRVRAEISDAARSSVETGIPVLDHLVGLMARYASLDLELEVEPGAAAAEATAAGWALGQALLPHLTREDALAYGSVALPAGEALAHVALEISGEPLVVANFDLTEAHVGGLAADVIGDFLESFASGAGLTLHVRLLEGDNPEHVLDAIFKALGAALAGACGHQRGGR
jgi:imidazoleglycerol-phosphate dehydratase